MGVCRTAHTMQTLADSQSAAGLKGPALPPLPPAHRYPGCFGSAFFGLARPPCAAVLRAWWYSHRDWSMCSRWSSGSPMWSTWLAGQSHRSPVSPRLAMHRCPSRSSTARRMDAQFGGSGEVRPLVALQGIPPPKLQPRRSSLVGGSTAGHTTGLAQGEERPSWWSGVARHGCHRHCCGRRRNRTPALSDLTVFKTVPAPRGVTFQCGDGRI